MMKSFSISSSGGDGDQIARASSSSTPPRRNYEVFLSFRGDTRYGFTDHLYHGLDDRGIIVFRDNEELYAGEKIDQLFEAIKTSMIAIPVISPDYASSTWCLKELLQILECKKTSGQLILPIFYQVKPSDVRNQKGNFGKKFRLCKKKHNLDGKLVQELENAFIEVASLKGWESDKTTHEGELVKIVVTRIFNELRKAILVVPDFLVGVNDHAKEINKIINAKPFHDAKIIAIHGMGGIGKTTLAKVLYNELSKDFECRSFIPNMQERSSKHKGLEDLQKQVISDILVDKSPREISHIDEGITIIQRSFRGKRLLLLLDDVENMDQLNKIVAETSWLGSESIAIVTTRNKDVLMAPAINLSYELNELNYDQSFKLFCKHAFGRNTSCPRSLETIAKDIVSTTGGLPLAVEIIGSMLYQKSEAIWNETLKKLRKMPNNIVRDKLKISYDSLEYEQQQIFLDIACFRIGHQLEFASYMWDSCGFYPEEGIQILISLSLIKMEEGNHLVMHDQLRDLGREIVRIESRNNIGKCSRLWLEEEAIEVTQGKQGTPEVQALYLNYSRRGSFIHCTSKQFEGMTNLRFLQMYAVQLTGDFEHLFPNLRWLQWDAFIGHNDFMGINFIPKKLVVLELLRSNISEYWNGWNQIKHLKAARLFFCQHLTTTPNFSTLKGLEVLILNDCWSLRKFHPSIHELCKTLKVLDVSYCMKLEELPIEVGEMEELKQLIIDGTCIREIPISKGHTTKLEILSTRCCKQLTHIPDSLDSLVQLQHLLLSECPLLTKIPESIGKLKLLAELDLSRTAVEELPNSIGELYNLESLHMSRTPIKCLPPSIAMLTKLKELDLEECEKLELLPKQPCNST